MKNKIRELFMQNDRIRELFKRDLERAGIEPGKYLRRIRYSNLDEAIASLDEAIANLPLKKGGDKE